MNSRPLLSIVIPTYRRPEFLRTQLSSIIPQTLALEPKSVEIVVVDNGLDEATRQVVTSLSGSRGELKYVRRPATVSMEDSIMAAYFYGDGSYVWTLGDDDALHP